MDFYKFSFGSIWSVENQIDLCLYGYILGANSATQLVNKFRKALEKKKSEKCMPLIISLSLSFDFIFIFYFVNFINGKSNFILFGTIVSLKFERNMIVQTPSLLRSKQSSSAMSL